MKSKAHILRNYCYKERTPKFNGMLHEESEEATDENGDGEDLGDLLFGFGDEDETGDDHGEV